MSLLLYGDGPRDEAVVPILLTNLLDYHVTAVFRAWKTVRVHGKGYGKKLAYAMRQARARHGVDGLVAVIDRDKDKRKKRWKNLARERRRQRDNGILVRCALGEAVPHGEAWLLDDREAVRLGLGLDPSVTIPSAVGGSPKAKLERLLAESPRAHERPLRVWPDIAQEVTLGRCSRPNRTGYEAFAQEVAREFG